MRMDHLLNAVYGVVVGISLYLLLTGANIIEESVLTAGIFVVAAYPWRIGKNVYSLFGGFNFEEAEEQGKEDGKIWSLISVIQYSKGNAFSVVNFVQVSAEGQAMTIIAVSLYQYGADFTLSWVGISLYQMSGDGEAALGIGLSFWQQSQDSDATMVAGISIFQIGKETSLFFGASALQKAAEKAMLGVGLVLFQISDKDSIIYGGLSLVQLSETNSFLGFGIPVFQNNRNFGFKAIANRDKV
ncbi:MAG: hypothetical protein UT42_C0005G0001 [Candidatus Falkowbacteria bacterium GW2011_GWA2_39_24]|uniref:Uncharacterized protein n=1 Tax=Candidatus Falkowbacteria bacterium GW2011_GWA2_39_24 TaxID=1618634 RepID=A0A0G0NR81_9BACT|nr:MAG: hypothetical protein UT42_C0005G0001 [Candidatus Falkowbacteria bacterium GW2011_GWA2_39_24]